MELLLRQNSFDIHNKPPAAGGLFDREYPHSSLYLQPAFLIFLPAAAGTWWCLLAPEMLSILITLSL